MSSPPLSRQPVWHSDVRGNDLDEARDFYARGYNGSGFRAERSAAPFSYRYASTAPGPVSLHSASFLGSVRGAVDPGGVYVVLWLTQGRASLDLGRDEIRPAIGQPAVFPTGRPFGFDAHEYRDALVHIDAAYLERAAAERHGTAPGPLRFAPTPGDTATWWAAVRVLRDTLASATAPTALQRDAAHRITADAMLSTFAHLVAALPPTPPSVSARRLRRAVEFVHANADLPLGVADIADAAGLTVRGVQLAFQRAFAQTPRHYLRGVRLDRAREELLAGSPGTLVVSDVAARWGFVSGGRFAQHYARRFGELPRQTLRA
ncbi:helix-turn-helix transcriptional regulator [Rathayibacter sp. VKM Ac-2754]|uniref:helix-turn-helix transcriptional regulator n=1 Tax=Rathayibacter sp. VKM Ac-2754 TaxID=2609251 RepID=UPI00135A54C8|nr:AraC family transcriptional regulator [Rathayibacter sp. VKM Ac-2754]MWV60183.1 helix-turn-helix domain-containing protein [Rathayibacter sp. VKM Ac-2754]